MKNCLVIGVGEAFTSFVQTIRGDSDSLFFRKSPVAYSLIRGEPHSYTEKLSPISFDESYLHQEELCVYQSVYLFVDEWPEGRDFITLFRQLGTCRIFVLTQEQQNASLYKGLGAHYVIISKPGYKGYRWLAEQLSG
ncbi:hypothetical protein AV540_17075 [Brevibacillus parabrevis]|uniref:hypothetical protein n=1 Tax=Brevibacillus parabrevis TaxID=54914 RepID=UPI0007ABD38E|nr:hypothetical protein [Brevibacillus parabrevis]KZE48311.1 hypothetical protein AV540_17075 [Brevibacillus parabrevis]